MAALLRGLAGKSNEFAIESIVEVTAVGYPIARMLGTTRPDVMLIEMSEFDRDVPLAGLVHAQCPTIPLVGLASRDLQLFFKSNPSVSLASVVGWPFTVQELEQAISVAVHRMAGGIYENLLAFLPGKAGSGASTVVLQAARVLALELQRRVLVMEGDLHSGLLSAMLQVPVKASIREALAAAPQADGMVWQRYITEAGGIDFLLTNTAMKEPVPSWTHYLQILRLAATKYDFVLVDLPEIVNSATAEVVRRARAVYVVSTPEFASLKLSQQRCLELNHWGVDPQRIHALLNRGHKSDIGAKDAEQMLGCPVAATLPNDYRAVRKAIAESSFIDRRSELGQAYLAFARRLAGAESEKKSWFWK
jgi:pilus assembly protein CpaE